MLQQTWCEVDLGHQHQSLAAQGKRARGQLQVHLGLAAPGHAVQQTGKKARWVKRCRDCGNRSGLLLIDCGRGAHFERRSSGALHQAGCLPGLEVSQGLGGLADQFKAETRPGGKSGRHRRARMITLGKHRQQAVPGKALPQRRGQRLLGLEAGGQGRADRVAQRVLIVAGAKAQQFKPGHWQSRHIRKHTRRFDARQVDRRHDIGFHHNPDQSSGPERHGDAAAQQASGAVDRIVIQRRHRYFERNSYKGHRTGALFGGVSD